MTRDSDRSADAARPKARARAEGIAKAQSEPPMSEQVRNEKVTDELKALRAFARAVDKAIVFDWGSRQTNPMGEQIGEIRCDRMGDDEELVKLRRIQTARDTLVRLGILEAVR